MRLLSVLMRAGLVILQAISTQRSAFRKGAIQREGTLKLFGREALGVKKAFLSGE